MHRNGQRLIAGAATAVGILAIVVLLTGPSRSGPVIVTIDSSERHQTWEAWEVTVNMGHRSDNALSNLDRHPVDQWVLDEIVADAADNLGITAIDLPVSLTDERHSIEPVNDNADPFALDDTRVRWNWIDPYIRAIVLPLKERVEARGVPFTFTVRAVAWNAWQWGEPELDPGQEYVEIVFGTLERLRSKFGLVPDYLSPMNEPDHLSSDTSKAQIIRGISKLAVRLQASGYPTKLSFPEVSHVKNTLDWFDAMAEAEPTLLPLVGRISFHGYPQGFERHRRTLNRIRARAHEYGLTTAQTEWWFTTDHPPDIITCMTEGDISVYQPFVLSGFSNNPERGPYGITYSGGTFPLFNATGWVRGPDWYELYQFSGFIRPGDVRIDATSSRSGIRTVAFEKPDGRQTVVVLNTESEAVALEFRGLAPGAYDIVLTDAGHNGEHLSRETVRADEALVFQLSAAGLVTIHAPAEIQASATGAR